MLGRSVADSASSSWDIPDAGVSDPEQLATKRRRTDRHARAPEDVLLLTLKGPSPPSIGTKLPLSFGPQFLSAAYVNP
jgi:hypothetical protein